jgi:hypothetical protein
VRGCTNRVEKKIYLLQADYHTLARLDPQNDALQWVQQSAIATAYHEGTHAFLNIGMYQYKFELNAFLVMKYQDRFGTPDFAIKFREFWEAGVSHYQGASLEDGSTSEDPLRLFKEAAAEYVGNRAWRWWLHFQELSEWTRKSNDGGRVAAREMTRHLRSGYNHSMQGDVLGYEERRTSPFSLTTELVRTRQKISKEMKGFLDHELLEDRIPDDFDAERKFKRMWDDLQAP